MSVRNLERKNEWEKIWDREGDRKKIFLRVKTLERQSECEKILERESEWEKIFEREGDSEKILEMETKERKNNNKK